MRENFTSVTHDLSDEYYNIEVYYHDKSRGSYKILKPKGIALSKVCSQEERRSMYIRISDQVELLARENKTLYKELVKEIKIEDLIKVKNTMVRMVSNFLAFPRNSNLRELSSIVNLIIDEFTKDKTVIRKLAILSNKDVTTAQHSVNVMSYTLAYCLHNNMEKEKIKLYGLSGLLHDVGKVEIDNSILTAPRKLTDEEYTHIKGHTLEGANILKEHLFEQEVIDGALHHHERMDGSGYPYGLNSGKIPEIGQILAIIDPFEALTTDERPYRKMISQTEALEILHRETDYKLNRDYYLRFIDSLHIITRN